MTVTSLHVSLLRVCKISFHIGLVTVLIERVFEGVM